MRTSTLVLVAASSHVLALPAFAGFDGLDVVRHTTVTIGSFERHVYRVYARFSQPDDSLVSWGGTSTSATRLYTGPCTGNAFYQSFPYNSNSAPSQTAIDKFANAQWDTFATIGVNLAEQGVPSDQTQFTLQFPQFIDGNNLMMTNAFVYAVNSPQQARADFAGDGDAPLRVLMMQLTVRADQYPYGYIGQITWLDGQGNSHTLNGPMSWVGLAAHGRCCLPTGECAVMYHSDCSIYFNGYFLNCQTCDSCALTCVPDVAPHPGDGVVNIDDLVAVITAWGPCSPWDTCPSDVSPPYGNNVVDIDDLVTVITSWGSCQ